MRQRQRQRQKRDLDSIRNSCDVCLETRQLCNLNASELLCISLQVHRCMCGNFSRQDSAHLTIFNSVHFLLFFLFYIPVLCCTFRKRGSGLIWTSHVKIGTANLLLLQLGRLLVAPSIFTHFLTTTNSSILTPSSFLPPQPQPPSLCDVADVFTFVVSTMAGSHWPLAAILFLFLLVNSRSSCLQTLPAVFLPSSILFRNFTMRLLDHLGCNR